MKIQLVLFIRFFCVFFIALITTQACNNSSNKNHRPVERDTTINKTTAYSSLELDSALLETYIAHNELESSLAEKMRDFYKNRNYHFAWFSPKGPTEQARAFYNLHNTYIKAAMDSAVYDRQLDTTMERLLNTDSVVLTRERLTQTELHLTKHFFQFTKEAYEGMVDPSELQWHIPKRKIDAVALLP